MKGLAFLVLVLLIATMPVASAQAEPTITGLRAAAGNQRIDLDWRVEGNGSDQVDHFIVHVFAEGQKLVQTNATQTQYTYFGTNERSYAFQIQYVMQDGRMSALSDPVSATPVQSRDLQYLATGLVVTWLGVLGYIALLARRESTLTQKLDQLLQHRPKEPHP